MPVVPPPLVGLVCQAPRPGGGTCQDSGRAVGWYLWAGRTDGADSVWLKMGGKTGQYTPRPPYPSTINEHALQRDPYPGEVLRCSRCVKAMEEDARKAAAASKAVVPADDGGGSGGGGGAGKGSARAVDVTDGSPPAAVPAEAAGATVAGGERKRGRSSADEYSPGQSGMRPICDFAADDLMTDAAAATSENESVETLLRKIEALVITIVAGDTEKGNDPGESDDDDEDRDEGVELVRAWKFEDLLKYYDARVRHHRDHQCPRAMMP